MLPTSRMEAHPPAETFNPQIAKGNWQNFNLPLDQVYEAAAEWKQALQGVDRAWLCWNVNPRWCAVQQRLVKEVGWTPVVGFDPRAGAPADAVPGAVVVDFNRLFHFPILQPHFVLEFAFLFTDRLAFWHSDLLCRTETMRKLVAVFESLHDGEMAAVLETGGLRNLFRPRQHRYWELVGCTTRGASADQFRQGTGWWRNFWFHPNGPGGPEREKRAGYGWDFGAGILYWRRELNGKVKDINQRLVEEGHCTRINYKGYKTMATQQQIRNLPQELDANYSLDEVAGKLGISHLLG